MQHTIKEGETNSTLFLSGEIDMSNADSIKDIARGLIKKKGDLIIHLKDVTYIDSSGISIFIEAHKNAIQNNVKCILKDVSKEVLKVIMMARLEEILIIE